MQKILVDDLKTIYLSKKWKRDYIKPHKTKQISVNNRAFCLRISQQVMKKKIINLNDKKLDRFFHWAIFLSTYAKPPDVR